LELVRGFILGPISSRGIKTAEDNRLFFVIFSFAFALARSPIIKPNPADFSQVTGFRAEWCSETLSPRLVNSICFGKARFQQSKSIRSVLVKKPSGDDLYVEDRWPGVELLKPRFGVVGPVLPSATGVESGEVLLLLDAEGVERGLILETPSLGSIEVVR
jgi:hypothetical protein